MAKVTPLFSHPSMPLREPAVVVIGWRRASPADPRVAELVMWDRRLRRTVTREIVWSPKQQQIPGAGLSLEFEGLWVLSRTRNAPEGHEQCYAAVAEHAAPHFPLMPPHYADWWARTTDDTAVYLQDYAEQTIVDSSPDVTG